MKESRVYYLAFAGLMFLAACSKDHSSSSACSNCPTISFKADIIPILSQNCATSGCHTGSAPQARLNLDSASAYSGLTAVGKGYVVAGDPSSSIMYTQMVAGSSQPMPPSGLLDQCTSFKVSCWIKQGAQNN